MDDLKDHGYFKRLQEAKDVGFLWNPYTKGYFDERTFLVLTARSKYMLIRRHEVRLITELAATRIMMFPMETPPTVEPGWFGVLMNCDMYSDGLLPVEQQDEPGNCIRFVSLIEPPIWDIFEQGESA